MLPVILAYVLVLGCKLVLRGLGLRHLRRHGDRVPPELVGVVDPATLQRMNAYTLEKGRLGTIQLLVTNVFVAAFLFGGVLRFYDDWVAQRASSFVWSGLLFFLGLFLLDTLVNVPFSLLHNFRIEERYGFNRMGAKLWLSDTLKSLAVGGAILSILVPGALFLVQSSPEWWWLAVWGFFLLFSIFLMYVSPYVIEPLFFKLEPLRRAGLEDAIRELVARAGLRASRVFQVDASRRSSHSNAYFTGLGRVKRIVLFDTLVDRLQESEILAVLAHEAGHWKKRHVLQRLLVTELAALLLLYAAYRLLGVSALPQVVGLGSVSFHARLLILGFLASLGLFPLTPLSSAWSRRHEWEADRFATRLTRRPRDLAAALAQLSRDNLANLHPHPLVSRFYDAHPPVVERIRRLRGAAASDGT
ncbi:MAG: M48 family metallopeptidase [Candidatus Latescibacterota bacterium]|nr:MAG: M48 family metallopeptidase [Candidatus Latescibacterota bacterium]